MEGWSSNGWSYAVFAGLLILALLILLPGRQPRNLVIFAFDGLQARHLAAYGYDRVTAPALEHFFESSFVFTNAVSPASWTVPSFMSVFTSRYPSEHKLTNKLVEVDTGTTTVVRTAHMQTLAPGIPTLAEILKSNGYATAAFTGDAGVKGEYGYAAGFDEYYDKDMFGGLDSSVPRALEWVAMRDKERPFFLFVHGYDVHGQHVPRLGFDYRFAPEDYRGRFTGSAKEQGVLRELGLAGEQMHVTDEDIEFWRGVYDEKILKADLEFDAFMQGLYEQDLLDSTIVVVVSDHGTEFFEHGSVDHGHTLYGELLDVLLAIRLPSGASSTVTDLVSTLDLVPTVLSILNLRTETVFAGADLSPAFHGDPVAHDVYSETDYRLYTHKRSITTTDGWKFILTRETGKKELYNLDTDPAEQVNIFEAEPTRAYELEQKLLAHLKAVGDTGPWRTGCLAVYADQCK